MNQDFLSEELEVLSENLPQKDITVDQLVADADRTRLNAERLYSLAVDADEYTVDGIYQHMSFEGLF